jgi:hypothetical protein
MTNERLRGAVSVPGRSVRELAAAVRVDPKTVERWIATDRMPHRATRDAVARFLGLSEAYLWPATSDHAHTRAADRAELVEFYAARSAVPLDLWRSLVDDARGRFDLLAYAGLFLPEQVDLVPRLMGKAREGVRVRVLLGDPEAPAVALRGEEEGLGDGMASRVRLSLRYFEEARGVPGLEVRLHGATLYASIVRADETLLVNTHVYGSPAAQSPVLHLRRVPGGRAVDHYLTSFERVWATARAALAAPAGG